MKDNMAPVMIGHLTPYNLYKVSLNNSSYNFPIIPSQVITTSTSKSAAILSVWHQRFTYSNKAFIKHLVNITSGMIIIFSSSTYSFCGMCVEADVMSWPHNLIT